MRRILLTLLVLIPVLVVAREVTKKTQSVIHPTTTPQTLFAKNRNRKGLIVSNHGQDSIIIQFGASTASDLAGMNLGASQSFQFMSVPMDSIHVKLKTSTGENKVGGIEFE